MKVPVKIPTTRRAGLALAFAAACVSGIAVFVNGLGVDSFDDATVYTTAKNAVAAAVLLLVLMSSARASSTRSPDRGEPGRTGWPGLLAVGLIGGSIPFVLFFEGLARASAPQAAFIHKTLVVWVALLAVPLLKERLGILQLVAIGLLVAGQAAMVGDLGAMGLGSGEVMIFGATLLWAVEFIVAKRLLGNVPSLTLGASRMGIGLLALLAWLGVTGRVGGLVSLSAVQVGWVLVTGSILAVFVGTWYAALARAQAVDVTSVLVFGAIVTAALSGAFDGVVPSGATTLGLTLIAAGTAAAAVSAVSRSAAFRGRP